MSITQRIPFLTAYMGNALCVGLKSKGTMAEPKHFAFNHQEANRSGLSTFMTEQAARENELRGFMMCMSSNNAQGVMTAFKPCRYFFQLVRTRIFLKTLQENEWGYQGWFVTDMINGCGLHELERRNRSWRRRNTDLFRI